LTEWYGLAGVTVLGPFRYERVAACDEAGRHVAPTMRALARDGWTRWAREAGERMRRPRVRFWQKVLAALLIVGVAPIALVSAVSTHNTRNDLTSLGVTNIRQRSTSTANAIDAYLASRLGDIILVAKLPDIINYATNFTDQQARAGARVALSAAAARSPEYESVAVVDPKGTIVAASVPTDEGTSVAFREYFLTAMKGPPYVSDPSYSVITNKPALFFSSPVAANGVVVAVVRTRV